MVRRKSEAIYDEFYASRYDAIYDDHEYDDDVVRIRPFLDRVGVGDRILDVGCGTGTHCAIVRESHPRVEGLDLSPAMLEVARRKNPGLAFTQGNLLDPGLFSPGTFVLIFSVWDVLNYLESTEEFRVAFDNFRRWLRPGGWLCVEMMVQDPRPATRSKTHADVNVDRPGLRVYGLWDLRDPSRNVYKEEVRTPEARVDKVHDLLLPTYEEARDLIAGAGFEVVEDVGEKVTPFFCCRADTRS